MTILICDMRGSTALGDLTTPTGLVAIINRYFTAMSVPVRQQYEIIDMAPGRATVRGDLASDLD